MDTPDESTSQSKFEFELYIVQAKKASYRRSTVRNCKINTNAAAKKRLLFHVFLISQYTRKGLLAFARFMI